MPSRVPLFNVTPDEQLRDTVKTRAFADTNGIADMDPAAPPLDSATASASRLPAWLRFPIVVIGSLSLSSLFYSLAAGYTGPELAAVSRNLTTGWHIAALMAWKVAELSIAWYACYDYTDLAYLTLLNNVPHYFLLNTFYGIDFAAALIPLAIDVATIAIPFALMRRMNHARAGGVKDANQKIAQDSSVQYLISLFGASIYSLVVYGSFATWLPQYMIIHFEGLRSLEKAHSTALLLLLALFGPLGYAATQFIFVPAIGSPGNPGITDATLVPENKKFDPASATLRETVKNTFGLGNTAITRRAEILAKRTLTLAAGSFINTFVRAYVTVEGTEILGALGWASVWALAAGLTGLAYAWVGNE